MNDRWWIVLHYENGKSDRIGFVGGSEEEARAEANRTRLETWALVKGVVSSECIPMGENAYRCEGGVA